MGTWRTGWLLALWIAAGCGGQDDPKYVNISGKTREESMTSTPPATVGRTRDDAPADAEPVARVDSGTTADADASTLAPTVAPGDTVRFVDDEGDAEGWPEMSRYPLDLTEVQARTQDAELVVRFTFARTIADHFAFAGFRGEHTAGVPAQLFLDVDGDSSTGIEPPWASESEWASELRGYEVELDVIMSYTYVDKVSGADGSTGGDGIVDENAVDITGYFADYWFMDKTPNMSLGPQDPDAGFGRPETRDLTFINGDVIEIHVPLGWLALKSGDVLRMMYREPDQGAASGVGYSRNQRLLVP